VVESSVTADVTGVEAVDCSLGDATIVGVSACAGNPGEDRVDCAPGWTAEGFGYDSDLLAAAPACAIADPIPIDRLVPFG